VRDCDQILVMEGGQVIERGTHDQLVAKKGYYAHLLTEGEE
jgi:ABC-type multidrug transport system fused ATPase/permease subunit